MSTANKKWPEVGSLLKSKAGGLYIKFKEDVTIKAGSTLMLQNPRTRLDEAVAAGRMDAEKAEEIKAKIPEYVKYNVILPPDDRK